MLVSKNWNDQRGPPCTPVGRQLGCGRYTIGQRLHAAAVVFSIKCMPPAAGALCHDGHCGSSSSGAAPVVCGRHTAGAGTQVELSAVTCFQSCCSRSSAAMVHHSRAAREQPVVRAGSLQHEHMVGQAGEVQPLTQPAPPLHSTISKKPSPSSGLPRPSRAPATEAAAVPRGRVLQAETARRGAAALGRPCRQALRCKLLSLNW